MAKWSRLLGGGRSLGVHLERLRLLLDGLGARLHDGVARAVGQTVAAAECGRPGRAGIFARRGSYLTSIIAVAMMCLSSIMLFE